MCCFSSMRSIDQCTFSLIVPLTVGIGTRATNHDSRLDLILSFNDWSTSLGECCSGHSRGFLPPVIWEIGRYIRTEKGSLDLSYVACRWRRHLWSESSYVTDPMRTMLMSDMFSISGEPCRDLLALDSSLLGSVSLPLCIIPVDGRIAFSQHLALLNLSEAVLVECILLRKILL